jgi:hypothetical protein
MSAENIVVIFDGSNKSKHGHIGAVFNKNGKQIECSEAEQPFSNSIGQVGNRYGRTHIFISEEAYPGTIMIKDIARYCVDSPERLKNAIFTIGNEYRTEQIQKRLYNNHNNANRQPNVYDSTNTPIKKIEEISNKGMPNFTKIYNGRYNGR